MTLKELNEQHALWDAARIVWEDCGHQIIRPIIALLERQEWAQAAQMAAEYFFWFEERGERRACDALRRLGDEITRAWERDEPCEDAGK